MKGIRKFRDRLKKDLQNPTIKESFEHEEIFASLAIQIAKFRQKEGLSQKKLAQKLHTTQQTISRIEDTSNRSFSVNTLVKVADALHRQLKIEIV